MGRTRAAASSSSSSAAAAAASSSAAAATASGGGGGASQKPLDRHLAALAGVVEESTGLRDGGLKGLDRKAATQRIQGLLGTVQAAYAHMQKLATPEAQEADEVLAVRVRDGKKRRKELVAAVGVLAVAQAAAAAVADGERNRRSSTAVQAAVAAALDTADSIEGGAATVEELRELLDQASDANEAVEAIKDQVGAGGDWIFSGYRPMEALGLLGEMAAWLRNALQHCGLRDTVQQLQAKADRLREARVDKYDEGFRVANGLRIKAKGLTEEGHIARKDYKSLHAALEFADLKYQSHLMNEAEIKRRLALLTEEEDEEEEDDAPPAKASPAKGKGKGKGKGKAPAPSNKRVTRGGSGGGGASSSAAAAKGKKAAEAGPVGLVKYLPALQREAVLALVEAASGKGGKGAKGAKGKGKQAAPKAVALKPLCAQHLGYNPNPASSSSSSADGTPSKQRSRAAENPFRTVLHVVDAIVARLDRECGRGGGAGGLKKRKGGPGGEDEEPYTIKRPKAVNSEQRQRRRWDVPETKRLLRGIVKFWQDGFRWRRIKEWDGRKGDKARLTHRNNLDLCEKSRSLLEKWEKEEGEQVDRDAYPTWAETLMHDEARLLRYCGGGGGGSGGNSEE